MKRLFARFSSNKPAVGRRKSASDAQNNARSPSPVLVNSPSSVLSEFDYFPSYDPSTAEITTTEHWSPEFASDPSAWEREFLRHWKTLQNLLNDRHNEKELVNQIKESLYPICALLVMEVNSQPEPSIGPILDHFFNEEVLLCVHEWALKMPLFLVPMCQVMLINAYYSIIDRTQSQNHCLLVHKPILIPLLRLLQWCKKSAGERRSNSSNVDRHFVLLLNQICRRIAEDSTLLHFFFHSSSVSVAAGSSPGSEGDESAEHQPFLVFSLLVPYLYAQEEIGQLARDALLLIMSVSREFDFIAKYVVQKSNFCPVLAVGLSGCFSQLPGFICNALCNIVDPDEFHKLSVLDIDSVPELYGLHNALLFCNAVVQVAHPDIVQHIIHFFYEGFLLEVFKSSLLEASTDELVSKVAYFHLCLDAMTEPPLIQVLIKVLLVAETNVRDMNLLELILSKMNTSENLCRVVLSLLRTLIDLRCEDLMWNTVLRYILPFIPLKPNSRRFDVNVSLNAASFFLQCVPTCTQSVNELNSENTFHAFLGETAQQIKETTRSCTKWAFKYDGTTPNSILSMINTEEVLSVRQPFVRLSSARSSYASTGWNRYFQNRSAHGTLEGDMGLPGGVPALNMLGEEDRPAEDGILDVNGGSGQEDFSDFNPQYEMMSDARLDYFHFAYEGISESDQDSSSRRGSYEDENGISQQVPPAQSSSNASNAPTDHGSANSSRRVGPRSEFLKVVLRTNWNSANTRDDFIALLDGLPNADKPFNKPTTTDENIALIDARFQYLEELRHERMAAEERDNDSTHPFRLDLRDSDESCGECSAKLTGLLITCTDEKGPGILLECLLDTLSRLMDHGFATNMQLFGVLNSLLSYPQPAFTSYLLYVDAIRSNALYRITNVLSELKTRIDAYAQGTDDFAELVRRGLRHRVARADSCNRRRKSPASVPGSGTGTFRFTHQQHRASLDHHLADSTRTKNFAYAAITLSQLAQLCAAYALQHCAAIEYSRGGIIAINRI